jgi:transcriptional regulator with XRE-family HTH domain
MSISARIRAHRKARGLTLHDIERLSNGKIKAVVMGSYERGTRAISLARTIEIANLFSIPVTELIEEKSHPLMKSTEAILFDLRRLNKTTTKKNRFNGDQIEKIGSFLNAICARRSDWNGEVLSLRSSDLDTLTLILNMPASKVMSLLDDEGLLIKATNHL